MRDNRGRIWAGTKGAGLFWIDLHGDKPVLTTNHLVLALLLMTMVFLGHFFMRRYALVDVLQRTPGWLLVAGWGIMIFALMVVQTTGQQFIYFQF